MVILTLSILSKNFCRQHLGMFFFVFLEIRIWHVMQIVSLVINLLFAEFAQSVLSLNNSLCKKKCLIFFIEFCQEALLLNGLLTVPGQISTWEFLLFVFLFLPENRVSTHSEFFFKIYMRVVKRPPWPKLASMPQKTWHFSSFYTPGIRSMQ